MSSLKEEIDENAIINEYKHLRITEDSEMVMPIPIVSIGNSPIITESNICVISGQPKEGKSSFVYYILSQAILPEFGIFNNDIWEGIDIARNTNNKAIIHIDTEQAQHNHVNAYKNSIWKRSGMGTPPDYFQSYNLRGLSVSECKLVLKKLLLACNKKFNGIYLIVIDGVTDLLKSVNDEEESNAVVRVLENIARVFKCAIIVVIHTNPGSAKQRGHLGSQLQRKAESVVLVKKEENVSYVEPQFLRNASNTDVPIVQFTFDKEMGYHVSAGIKEKKSLTQDKEDNHKDTAGKVFTDKAISNKDAISSIVNITGKSQRTAQNYLSKMVELKFVCKTEEGYILKVE
ncbi:MAG: hypothetical protein V4608_17470 [Bacteroidota bacterium]